MKSRAFSLIELLISMAIILVLLFVVSEAIVQTLKVEAAHAGRAGSGRTASELAERMQQDARDATAVFIPSVDVLGNANSGPSGSHEVDFFRRLSAGGDAYTAYSFDSSSGSVTRYEYTLIGGVAKISNADVAGSALGSFAPQRVPVASTGNAVGATNPSQVTILYGRPELKGGNDVVVVNFQTSGNGGSPGQNFTVHLASRAAPTSLAILAPTSAPTSPPTTVVIPIILLRPGWQVHLPHGPWHGGNPGDPNSSIHWVAATGNVAFFGNGPGLAGSWFDFSSLYNLVTSGTYIFHTNGGGAITATVSCVNSQCPVFHPMPVSAGSFTPVGGVAFQTL